jgi:hypothetical protein
LVSVAVIEARETDMNDWKLSPMPIVMLRGWAYDETPHRRTTSKHARPTRRAARFGTAMIRGLCATIVRTTSR